MLYIYICITPFSGVVLPDRPGITPAQSWCPCVLGNLVSCRPVVNAWLLLTAGLTPLTIMPTYMSFLPNSERLLLTGCMAIRCTSFTTLLYLVFFTLFYTLLFIIVILISSISPTPYITCFMHYIMTHCFEKQRNL